MGFYIGESKKQKVIIDGVIYRFDVFSEELITNGMRLLSSDGYVLIDSKLLYLTAKESD